MVRRNYGRKAIYERIKQMITKISKQRRKTGQAEVRWSIGDETGVAEESEYSHSAKQSEPKSEFSL